MIVPGLGNLLCFPCALDKRPLVKAWPKAAKPIEPKPSWPLVGVLTGAVSGFDVIDVDAEGLAWLEANPLQTRKHKTPHGWHVFTLGGDLSGSADDRIAPGVHVRANGNYVCWWPRQGYPVIDLPLAAWPAELLAKARAKAKREAVVATNMYRSNSKSSDRTGRDDGGAVGAALFKLNPISWRDYERWFELMMACKAVGISVDDFVQWSVQDPDYAGDGEVIARLWQGAPARHRGALMAALKAAGIRVGRGRHSTDKDTLERTAVHASRKAPSDRKAHRFDAPALKPRLDGITRWLKHNTTEDDLFSAACLVAEIMVEYQRPKPSDAMKLLKGAAKDNGLWALLGAEGVGKTIANGFAHVEERVVKAA